MRRSYKRFVAALVAEAKPGADLTDAACNALEKLGWAPGGLWPPKREILERRARYLLRQHDIQEAVRHLYAETAEFTSVEAARTLAEHIRGQVEVEQAALSKDGQVVRWTVRAPKSLAALKMYNDLTVPKPARQVKIDQRTLVAKVDVAGEPPGMNARQLEPPRNITPKETP